MCSISPFAISSPRPLPGWDEASIPRRSNGWNSRGSCSRDMPYPVSEIFRTAWPGRTTLADQRTSPAGRLYLIALVDRFSKA